jgi:dipeptidyl-peptidase-3
LTPTSSNSNSRLGITQHLIHSGIAQLEQIRDDSGGLVNLYVRVSETGSKIFSCVHSSSFLGNQVDRNLVLTKGREAAGKLLIELQVRKSTADGPGARAFYNDLTTPIAGWEGEIRDLVLAKKQVWNFYRPLTSSRLTILFFSHAKFSSNPIHFWLTAKSN